MTHHAAPDDSTAIAIVGMAGRFPGAPDLEAFWRNLRDGVESISFFSRDELRSRGFTDALLDNPRFVAARGVLEDADLFDAGFFGYTPREAELMDPQQRLFLECGAAALDDAGYDPDTFGGMIGVYAGVSVNSYLLNHVGTNPEIAQSLATDKDFLATRLSYKLNLRGPSMVIQTACSTSLVAVCHACQALLDYHCDVAVSGAASVTVPQRGGYLHVEGGIMSPDGHCRAFDAAAQGTVGGDGVGVVVLKRLADALNDGDTIHAIIRGFALNNDGAMKIGYTAPSVDGQAQVVAMAQSIAGVPADSISYVETHGTGTTLGDPIEIAALTKAFRAGTARERYCAIGSVKTNIGHLDATAGIAGLIKTVLALRHREIPPSLHFETPNPKIDFDRSPFFVNTRLTPWQSAGARRAGVSSFGIGGTNAHVVLEEAPPARAGSESRPWQILTLSARTPEGLDMAAANLERHLASHPDTPVADAAFTLQGGRRLFAHRRAVLCRSTEEARAALAARDPRRVLDRVQERGDRPVVFMFPGQGTQRVGMGRELYTGEPAFARAFDECATGLAAHCDLDLRAVLHPSADGEARALVQLQRTSVTQAALFATEYALARLWMSWGIRPHAMIGHSIGEYVAATLSGVLSLDDALSLVAERGRLMEQAPDGAMTAVHLPEADVRDLLGDGLWLAAVNGPSLSVVSGEPEAIGALEDRLEAAGLPCQRLLTSAAFHSGLMAGVMAPLTMAARRIRVGTPAIPYISNVSGTWISEADLADRQYWGRQVREAVQFAAGVEALRRFGARVFLEVGPGQVLSTIVRHSLPADRDDASAVASLPYSTRDAGECEQVAGAVARLWLNGAGPSWSDYHAGERRRRIQLPTYPFERKRHWVTRRAMAAAPAPQPPARPPLDAWFHIPSWKRSIAPRRGAGPARCLLFLDRSGAGERLAGALAARGTDVVRVIAGERFEWLSSDRCMLRPGVRDDYDALVRRLREDARWPETIAHLWGLDAPAGDGASTGSSGLSPDAPFWTVLSLVQAVADAGAPPTALTVVTSGVCDVTGAEDLDPLKAAVLGVCRVAPQELPSLRCRLVDVDAAAARNADAACIDALVAELTGGSVDRVVAWRGIDRWSQTIEPAALPAPAETPARLRPRGTYLITGGLSGLGLVFARHLAETTGARLVLTARRPLPERAAWSEIAASRAGTDPLRRQILAIEEMERCGAEVMIAAADVTDESRMREVVEAARARFGRIDGVIHSAGVPGGGVIQLKTAGAASAVLAPKVAGTLVLERVLASEPLDFVVLCSSLTSLAGGVGQVDYCAANAFLDAYARMRTTRAGVPTIAINWDTWGETGMAVDAALPDALRPAHDAAVRTGISSEEGIEVLRRALSALPLPQLIVSVAATAATATAAAASASASAGATAIPAPAAATPASARPRMVQAYVAPSDDVERWVCGLWEALIGVRPVGVQDSFFDLGGHSFLAIQVMSRLNQQFGTAIPIARLYEGLTPGFLAGLVREQIAPGEEEAEMAPASREALPYRDELRRRRLQARRTQEKTV